MKSQSLTFERILTSTADAAWNILSRLDGVAEWAPLITSCRVQSLGGVTVRTCSTVDGGTLRERIIKNDPMARSLDYTVEEGLPVSRYQGSMHVTERDDFALLVWKIEMSGDELGLSQVNEMLSHVAAPMLAGLDRLASRKMA